MKNLLVLLLVIMYSLYIKGSTFDSVNMSALIYDFHSEEDYKLVLKFVNNSDSSLEFPYSQSMVYENNKLNPNLNINLINIDDGEIHTYRLKSKSSRIAIFNSRQKNIILEPKSCFVDTLDLSELFGDVIPLHNMLYVSYEKPELVDGSLSMKKLTSNLVDLSTLKEKTN